MNDRSSFLSTEAGAKRGWHSTKTLLPTEDVKVMVISPSGEELVMFRKGNLWFFEGGDVYAYWTPVFWRKKVNL